MCSALPAKEPCNPGSLARLESSVASVSHNGVLAVVSPRGPSDDASPYIRQWRLVCRGIVLRDAHTLRHITPHWKSPLGESRHGGRRRQHLGLHGDGHDVGSCHDQYVAIRESALYHRCRRGLVDDALRWAAWSKGGGRTAERQSSGADIGAAATATAVVETSAAWAGRYDALAATLSLLAWSSWSWIQLALRSWQAWHSGGPHHNKGGAEQRAWAARHAVEAGTLRVLGDRRAAYYIAAGSIDHL